MGAIIKILYYLYVEMLYLKIRELRELNTRTRQNVYRDDSVLDLYTRRTQRLLTERREREIVNRRNSNEQEIRQIRNENTRERQSLFGDSFGLESIARRTQRLSGEIREPVNSGRRVTEDRESRIARDLNTRYRESQFRDDSALELNTRHTQRKITERRGREIVNRREANEREVRDIRDVNSRVRRSSFSDVFALDSMFRRTQRVSVEIRKPVNLGRRVTEDREIRNVRDLSTRLKRLLLREKSILDLNVRQSKRLSEERQIQENVERRVDEGTTKELKDFNTRIRLTLFRDDSDLEINAKRIQRLPLERRERVIVNRRKSSEQEIRQLRGLNTRYNEFFFRDDTQIDTRVRGNQRLLAVRREQLKSDRRTREDREIRIPEKRNTFVEQSLIRGVSASGLNARRIHHIHADKRERENENRRVAENREIRIVRELSTRLRRSLIRENSALELIGRQTLRLSDVRREHEYVDERVSKGKIRELRDLNTRVRQTLFRDDSALELNARRSQRLPVKGQERVNFDYRLSEVREIKHSRDLNIPSWQFQFLDSALASSIRRVQRLSTERRERVDLETRVSNVREISMARDINTRVERSLYHVDFTQDLNARRDVSRYISNERNVLINSRRSNNRVIESSKNFRENTLLTSKLHMYRENRMTTDLNNKPSFVEIRSDSRYIRSNKFYRSAESQMKSELRYDNRHYNYVTLLPQKPSEGKSGTTIDWATVIQILGSMLLIFLSANSNSKLSLMDKFGWAVKEQSQWTF